MSAWKLVLVLVLVMLIPYPSLAARLPTSAEAEQCVVKADKNLLAGMWNKTAHLCSEYFALERVDVTDISRAANIADVMINLQYRVLMPSGDGIPMSAIATVVQLCTGVTVSGSDGLPGTTLSRKARKISMQEWATGWKCKE
jgi:hypothetical protein